MNKTIILNSRPVGKPQLSDFKFVEEEMPALKEGEILLKTKFVSVDPYLRGRMSDAKSYVPPFELQKAMSSGVVAEVLESQNEKFKKGDFVSGMLNWKEFQTSTGENLLKIDDKIAPLSNYLGVLGMTGLTAYFGLTEIGKPQKGETLVVSGAAGAVGSIVGQIGKILGCRVIGIAGTDEKVEMLKSKFGFDEAINYKTTENMTKAIAEVCPDGVDVYFDNVGGTISDSVHANINRLGRIIVCGAISAYNDTSVPQGPRVEHFLIRKSALMQGFIVGNYADKFPEGMKHLSQWLSEGKLIYSETIVEGFENIPQAFIDLFEGKNKGKMIVKI
ncbi:MULTISPECIES: NADP-dependent oxidoreductase [Kaistella]|uniref:NADP-dependent oxidoreductase n=1 Tax=Kaistella TaxID=2782231 RepID=UPI00273410B4|nr:MULTISPECIES: NADP-dependent oxidoreductase [Kaistella]MDP2455163.1 NADP-dependent oxidoreductase [Kaistella sp. SH11-4b]MDP2458137.1 NADP-dependent oxidoreductase [Kaistella sp. SH40-3]MDP2460930.1 NADP-dependent oxidoreductase [Kaistella sp. SH19-2b]